MKPLHFALLLFCLAYGGSLALHAAAVGAAPADGGIAWHVWYAAGAACLGATCVELVVWVMWLCRRFSAVAAGAGVPLRLSAHDRLELLRRRPSVALLMPAHNEASTPDDREALAARIYETLLRTPSYSTFFLLADSPASQRANEMEVIREVRRRLHAAGLDYYDDRIVLEEYRDKPKHWRHKCGSLLMWLRRFGQKFEYMFVLDADSSLPDDPHLPETSDVIERMLVAMHNDSSLAMVQASIQIRDYSTAWGAIQAINTRIGSDYYFRVFSYVYDRAAPCYGHNCLFRVGDFAAHLRNTLDYTSHDHIDSADLAAAGRGCVLTDAVVTYEQPEDTVSSWLKRECRWSRGNGQWLVYLLRKRPLPLGVAVYLLMGIMQYVWALLASLLLISAAVLIWRGETMVARPEGIAARLLVGLVLFSLLVPKLIAAPTFGQFLLSVTCSAVVGPTLVLYQGLCFVLGAFGTRWVPRGARANGFDLAHATGITATFLPATVLGILLWRLVGDNLSEGAGALLVASMVVGMMLSPLTGLFLSMPLRGCMGNLNPRAGVT